jgi:hypothetical protein
VQQYHLNTPQKVQLFLVPICDTISSMLQPYNSRYDRTCSTQCTICTLVT